MVEAILAAFDSFISDETLFKLGYFPQWLRELMVRDPYETLKALLSTEAMDDSGMTVEKYFESWQMEGFDMSLNLQHFRDSIKERLPIAIANELRDRAVGQNEEIIAALENFETATHENATTILQLLNDQSTNFGGMFDQLTEHLASRQKQANKNTATIKDAVHAQTKRKTPI